MGVKSCLACRANKNKKKETTRDPRRVGPRSSAATDGLPAGQIIRYGGRVTCMEVE